MATGQIGRLLTAMVTPFDEEGKVSFPLARRLAIALVDSGSDGLVVAGTTGESPTLAREEKLRLFAEVKEAVGSSAAVVASTGNYSTQESVELTREAARTGVDAVMAVVPYYNKPTQEGLYRHFRAIAESTALPLILYNVPTRTSLNMAAETVVRLSGIDNIIGLKEAGGDLEQAARIVAGAGPRFKLWSGNDSDTFPLMCLGGYGVVSVASHLVGRQIRHMMELTVQGKLELASQEHRRLLPLFRVLFVVSNPIPVKYAVSRAGFQVGEPRLPLLPPDQRTAAQIDETLKGYVIDLSTAVARAG
ncbi:MAG: 4-hydroxy-tetrahydrodipicolinate synthase [Chloroflexi bacterium]|nr:4-hydroxy-tetrahydrodipicolinate synthase [Chloroflexota bacterium]